MHSFIRIESVSPIIVSYTTNLRMAFIFSPFLGSPNETLRGYFGEIMGSFGFVKG